jgi:hypothetical protein
MSQVPGERAHLQRRAVQKSALLCYVPPLGLPDAAHAVQRVYALDVFEEMLTRSVQDLLVGGHVAGTMSNVGLMSLAHRVPLGLP